MPVATKYRKNGFQIMISNWYSRFCYVTKWFKTWPQKLIFLISILGIVYGFINTFLWWRSGQAFDFSNKIKCLFIITSIIVFLYNIAFWTRTSLGGSKPESKFKFSKLSFLSPRIQGDSQTAGQSKIVQLSEFPDDGTKLGAYVYYTIVTGENINRMAYNETLEKWLCADNRISFDFEYFNRNKSKTENDVINAGDKSKKEFLRLALEIESRSRTNRRMNFFNSPKVTLRDLKFVTGKSPDCIAACGHTSYFTSAITNDVFSKSIVAVPTESGGELIDFRKFYPATIEKLPDGRKAWSINPLENCDQVSNHIGSVIMATTSDGFPVLCRQDEKSRYYGGRLVASGSGSLEADDLDRALEFAEESKFVFDDFLSFGMTRELLEETGIIPQNELGDEHYRKIWDYRSRVKIVSYYRDLSRSGLPIFVGFGKLDIGYKELCKIPQKLETKIVVGLRNRIYTALDMKKFLHDYIYPNGQNISADFSDQILLIEKLLERENVQKAFDRVLAYNN